MEAGLVEQNLIVLSSRPFSLGAEHRPYMVLSRGGSGPFNCQNCKAFSQDEHGCYRCSSPEFQAFMGTSLLPDENGRPLDDPTRSCSDWYQPREK